MDGDLTAVGCRLDGNKLGFPDAIAAWLKSFSLSHASMGWWLRTDGKCSSRLKSSSKCVLGEPVRLNFRRQSLDIVWQADLTNGATHSNGMVVWVQSMQSSVVSFWESLKIEGVSNQLCQQHVFGKELPNHVRMIWQGYVFEVDWTNCTRQSPYWGLCGTFGGAKNDPKIKCQSPKWFHVNPHQFLLGVLRLYCGSFVRLLLAVVASRNPNESGKQNIFLQVLISEKDSTHWVKQLVQTE